MKYFIGLIIFILFTQTGLLYGQKTNNLTCKVTPYGSNHFSLITDSLPVFHSENADVKLVGDSSTIVIDSFNFINTPVSFGNIYIITRSDDLPKVKNINNYNIKYYYYNYLEKRCDNIADSLNRTVKDEQGVTKQNLSNMIVNNTKGSLPNLVIFTGNNEVIYTVNRFYVDLKKSLLHYAIITGDSENRNRLKLPKNYYYLYTQTNEIDINKIKEYYSSFKKLQCFISLKKPISKKVVDTIQLTSDNTVIPILFSILPPKEKVNPYTKQVEMLFNQGDYINAFFVIKDHNIKFKKSEIKNIYKKNYENGVENAFSKNNLLDYLNFSEKDWRVDTMSFINYKSLKNKYLELEYKKLKGKTKDKRLLLPYLKLLTKMHPKSIKYEVDLLNTKGDIALSRNDRTKALDLYDKSYKLSHADYRLNKIKKILSYQIKNNCLAKYRKALWDNNKLIKKYDSYIKNDYSLNYYAACTYYKLAFYKKSAEHYQWLNKHYNNLNTKDGFLISKKEIADKLYDLLLKNCNYYEACNVSQTVCYDTENPDSITTAFQNYLASFKGAYFISIVNALKGYLSLNKNRTNLINNIKKIYSNSLNNNAIESVFIYYPSLNKQIILKGEANKTLNTKIRHLNSFPVTTNSLTPDKNLFFLAEKVKNHDDSSPVIVLSYKGISTNKDESNLISFLRNKKNITETWLKLNAFEQKLTEETIITWIASVIESSHSVSEKVLNSYWNKLNSNSQSIIKYFIVFDNTGKQYFSKNYNHNDYIYDNLLWEKSKTTPLFFKQQIKNRNNQSVNITDISFPVNFNNSSGVLKLGIKQICN